MKIFNPLVAIAIITVVIAIIYATVKLINRSNVTDSPTKIVSVLKDKLLKSRPGLHLSETLEGNISSKVFFERNHDSGKAFQSSAYLDGRIRPLPQGDIKHIRKYCEHWSTRQPNLFFAWLWELPGSMLHL